MPVTTLSRNAIASAQSATAASASAKVTHIRSRLPFQSANPMPVIDIPHVVAHPREPDLGAGVTRGDGAEPLTHAAWRALSRVRRT